MVADVSTCDMPERPKLRLSFERVRGSGPFRNMRLLKYIYVRAV